LGSVLEKAQEDRLLGGEPILGQVERQTLGSVNPFGDLLPPALHREAMPEDRLALGHRHEIPSPPEGRENPLPLLAIGGGEVTAHPRGRGDGIGPGGGPRASGTISIRVPGPSPRAVTQTGGARDGPREEEGPTFGRRP